MNRIGTQTLGYPRIGKQREMKRALESYWRGELDPDRLMEVYQQVGEVGWSSQLDAGIELIGVGSLSLYDQVLDWTVRFGLVPDRFRPFEDRTLDLYFAMARGAPGAPALALRKWFDTNYHYLVPEIAAGIVPRPNHNDFLVLLERAQAIVGERAVPIVLGPLTLLRMARLVVPLGEVLDGLVLRYQELLGDLLALGVPEVQFHEPALVLSDAGEWRPHYEAVYAAFAEVGVPLNLVAYFDDLGDAFPWVVDLPVDALSLDFTRGDNLGLIRTHGWPEAKALGAGLVDGRNVWRIRPEEVLPQLEALEDLAPALRVGPSCPLQFVPYSAAAEEDLPAPLRGVLACAEEKLAEVVALAQGETGAAAEAWARFRAFAPERPAVRERVAGLVPGDFERAQPYAERRPLQVQLPLFPATTIGSFPQTAAVRQLRAQHRRGEISEEAYRAGIDAFIAHAVGVQEGIGLDVPVHGEFERTDMVEYFAQQMTGFAFTRHGWVQSFGSRYVRPPIIYGDVARTGPMTVRAYTVAQALTAKPVKGMLTGPVTILNWSYPRTDLPRQEIAFQIALALREEIADLEATGARIVQVDEPALREGLPLKEERAATYLTWAVDAFRLATAQAAPETQVHTHMCYSEFGPILAAIDRMDADVISIENARSSDETLRELAEYGYEREVGPGVYDIHSPVVPTVAFILEKLESFVRYLRPEQIWVNPDCGLKTRAWEEVLPALRNLRAAVVEMRRRHQ